MGGLQQFFLSKLEISLYQFVQLDELITNHPNRNYLSYTDTEIFGLVTSNSMCFGGAQKIVLSKIEISVFFQNVALVELIMTHPIFDYLDFTVLKIIGLQCTLSTLTFSSYLSFKGWVKQFLVKNRKFCFFFRMKSPAS